MGATEPDRFLVHIPTRLPKGAVNTTVGDWQKIRACFVAAGFDWSVADKVMRYLERRSGVWLMAASATTVALTSSAVADPEGPTIVTSAARHGLRSGDTTTLAGMSGGTPDPNGARVVTVLTDTTFTIPVTATVGSTGGTMTQSTDLTRRLLALGLASIGEQSSRAKYVAQALANLASVPVVRWTTIPTIPPVATTPK